MNKEFLYTLLDSMSVSGHEISLQKKVIAEMTPHCDRIQTDYTGNVISIINPDASFKVLLTGHIDEIGLVVTNIQSDGLLRVTNAGGIRAEMYPGHKVVVYGEQGPVYGAVIPLKDKKDIKATDLMIDIGASNEEEARQFVQEGDVAHFHTYHEELLGERLCGRAIDDRGGAFIILEALKQAKERGCQIGVYAATTTGEETTMRGAHWAGSAVNPDVAIVVDVTYAQDYPGTNPNEGGKVELGKGPVLCNSSIVNPRVNALLKSIAQEKNIPYQVETYVGRTGTDADKIHFANTGVVTALVSLPLRYMHSPSEVCDLRDVENCIELLANFLCTISSTTNLDPFLED